MPGVAGDLGPLLQIGGVLMGSPGLVPCGAKPPPASKICCCRVKNSCSSSAKISVSRLMVCKIFFIN